MVGMAEPAERPSLKVAEPKVLPKPRGPGELVFGRTAEPPFVPSTIRAVARSAWTDAGLEPFTLHEARHTYTSMMVAAGIDPAEVMRRVGHASVALTLERYTHETDRAAADTAAALQSYIDAARVS
jgi:integrase